MKQYQYKIQWLVTDTKQLKKLIEVLGVRSLTCIYLRNYDLKIIDVYDRFIQYPYGLAEKETMKDIKKLIKNNKEIKYIEVLRK